MSSLNLTTVLRAAVKQHDHDMLKKYIQEHSINTFDSLRICLSSTKHKSFELVKIFIRYSKNDTSVLLFPEMAKRDDVLDCIIVYKPYNVKLINCSKYYEHDNQKLNLIIALAQKADEEDKEPRTSLKRVEDSLNFDKISLESAVKNYGYHSFDEIRNNIKILFEGPGLFYKRFPFGAPYFDIYIKFEQQ